MMTLLAVLLLAPRCGAVAFNKINTAAERAQVAYIQKQIDIANQIDVSIAALPRNSPDIARLRKTQAALFSDALRLTLELFKIQPVSRTGPIIHDQDLAGFRAKWDPVYEERVPMVRVVTHGTRQVGLAGSINGDDAMTWADGHISISRDAFRKSPGYLAAIILHETRHFEQATTEGEADKKTTAELEHDAYMKTLGVRDAFELTTAEMDAIWVRWQQELDRTRADYLKAVESRGGYRYGGIGGVDDPEEARARAEVLFVEQTKNTDELSDEFERFRGDEAERARRQEIERAREAKEAEAELNRRPSDDVLSAAEQCEFEVRPRRVSPAQYRDRTLETLYDFPSMSDPDAARLNLMITRACVSRALGQKTFRPCNDSLDSLASRWGEPGFKDRVGIATVGKKECFDMVKASLSATATARDVSQALDEWDAITGKRHKEWQRQDKARKRREKEDEARKTRDERIREREERQRREGGENIDLSPAEEARRRAEEAAKKLRPR